ncbi:MAG: ABC transporter permease subunit [Microlunatus sp.]|nr:ABC transporter permease subunit [Microlunatus sp.]MDN5771766.1 ABC transporter permease subunit [Microlunatus sp.]
MSRALRAEMRRLLSRRLTLIAVLGLLALVALFQLAVGEQVSPPSTTEAAQYQQEYDEYVQDWEANHQEWETSCLEDGGTADECATPRPEPSDWGLAPSSYEDVAKSALSFAVYLGGMVVFVVTVSFIGAEVTTGALANWLTFVPDRNRVFASKLIVVTGFSAVVGVGVGVVTVAASAVITALYGQPLTGLDSVVATAGRGALLVVVFGIVGYCVGLLTGSTGAGIGVLLAGIFVVFVRNVIVFSSQWAQQLAPWSPEVNLEAILANGTTYQVATGSGPVGDEGSGFNSVERTVSLAHGLGYWAVLLAVIIVVTWVVFRRRDVT